MQGCFNKQTPWHHPCTGCNIRGKHAPRKKIWSAGVRPHSGFRRSLLGSDRKVPLRGGTPKKMVPRVVWNASASPHENHVWTCQPPMPPPNLLHANMKLDPMTTRTIPRALTQQGWIAEGEPGSEAADTLPSGRLWRTTCENRPEIDSLKSPQKRYFATESVFHSVETAQNRRFLQNVKDLEIISKTFSNVHFCFNSLPFSIYSIKMPRIDPPSKHPEMPHFFETPAIPLKHTKNAVFVKTRTTPSFHRILWKTRTTTPKTQLLQKSDHPSHNTQKPTFSRKIVFSENSPKSRYFRLHHLPPQFFWVLTKFHKIMKPTASHVKTCVIDDSAFSGRKWWPSFLSVEMVTLFAQNWNHEKWVYSTEERKTPKFRHFRDFCENPQNTVI